MPASWGQRSAARAASRWRSEVLVDSGGFAIWPSCPTRPAAPWSACLPVPMSYALVMLSALSWSPCPGGPLRRSAWCCGHGSCCSPRRRRRTARSRSGWASARTRPASGGAGTARRAWRAGRCSAPRQAARVPRPRSWPRSRPWPASCPPPAGRRWPAGPAPNWPARQPPAASPRAVSPSTVRRWLADDAIKPWQHRSWIFPRDPHFAVKASRVLDLYQREWEGQPLGERRVRAQRR